MAKMTKTATIAALAEAGGISKKQAVDVLEKLASLTYAHAGDVDESGEKPRPIGFVIPGIGKVSVRQTKARKMIMQFGDRKGQEIDVPAKTKLKFTFLKVAKEAILS